MSKQINHCGYAAIVGRPNVGKSTLLNQILGVRLAITSHKAQTTRHSVLGVNSLEGGQIIYVDTPGIHQRSDNAMNRYLNRTAQSVLTGVDLLIFVVEALRWTEEDEKVLGLIRESEIPAIAVVNKVDLVKQKEALLPYLSKLSSNHEFLEIVPLSAKKGKNLAALEGMVLNALPEADNVYPDDQLTDRPEKFFAAEMIREQITRRYAKELPYAVSVEIERFEEQQGLYRINAVIWVEKPGQKGIIIGKDGQALKEVAVQARKAMQSFFDCKVHLELWVKVKKSWSSDEAALVRLGYGEQ
ncbi:MAG: GTPase Era [Candidatus Thiodiazotropha lotti]|uniref:GTPase Era n=1 Tax=Candidatus Thiodiazotropha endoloripes TaxID=1818881 RepID=A0A1E2UT45_9GAMM|nr:GTPase Era [Candidatus Thiodiazotropha endoloripes]MCG7898560.1 GTPase Era [Candidatus Thiodiazotropha weberae]MCG7990811.1 GTPase Era [Candidatus Thiodiazotropha lotti]MCG7999325.1 GTPase Era [Candidatus Thiodiazotropha lotti]MCW4182465.1 GTPase Era [Candidatus Thiodiazotropha weberae]MCW4191093.1 GTPase Era [Candidatus Thiodiazotropha weberae]